MAVRTKEELMEDIKAYIGDDTSDVAITLIENVNDTISANTNDGEDWKKKFEDNDREWRQKYKDRFFSGEAPADKDGDGEEEKEEVKDYSYDKLFKEEN